MEIDDHVSCRPVGKALLWGVDGATAAVLYDALRIDQMIVLGSTLDCKAALERVESLRVDMFVCDGDSARGLAREAASEIGRLGDFANMNLRERHLVELLCKGLHNQEIADQLKISTRTVKWYLNRLFLKFDVTNRTELVGRITSLA